MQGMRLGKAARFHEIYTMPTEGRRCLGRVRSMQGFLRDWNLLGRKRNRIKGGTVVPPCDFHVYSSISPVNKGVPP